MPPRRASASTRTAVSVPEAWDESAPDPSGFDEVSERTDPSPPRTLESSGLAPDEVLLELYAIETEIQRRRTSLTDGTPPLVAERRRGWIGPARSTGNSFSFAFSPSKGPGDPRLLSAQRAVRYLDRELSALNPRAETLSAAIRTIQQELERSAEGLDPPPIARSSSISTAEVEEKRPTVERATTNSNAGHSTSAESADIAEPNAPYRSFTAARYNRTIGGLQARRGHIAAGTLLVSALLSAALLFLTLRAPVSSSTPWVSVLPVVWMVPVPFFVLAFRGTLRMLGRGPLLVPEAV
jgi:hypothetical protein